MTNEQIRDYTDTAVYVLTVLGTLVAIILIITGHLIEYKESLDKLIGVLMVVSGIRAKEIPQ